MVKIFKSGQHTRLTWTMLSIMKEEREGSLTSWPANKGMYSIMASLTLHLVSSASSTIAGNKFCDNCLVPTTYKIHPTTGGVLERDKSRNMSEHVRCQVTSNQPPRVWYNTSVVISQVGNDLLTSKLKKYQRKINV